MHQGDVVERGDVIHSMSASPRIAVCITMMSLTSRMGGITRGSRVTISEDRRRKLDLLEDQVLGQAVELSQSGISQDICKLVKPCDSLSPRHTPYFPPPTGARRSASISRSMPSTVARATASPFARVASVASP